jgi:hypothetical protein
MKGKINQGCAKLGPLAARWRAMIVDNGVITLTSETATCQVAPRAGGAVAGFWWKRDGRRIDWLRPASPSAVARRDAEQMA